MQQARKYPVGVQVFEKIREQGLLYVDKTRYVYDLTHMGGSYAFLSRPRRFGKTLLVSTLEAYFQGRHELFEGLAIDELEHEWESYPVLRFDLSAVKSATLEGLERDLDTVLRRMEAKFGRDPQDEGWSARIEGLITRACKQTGKQAVVLVDEYDAPMLNVLHDPQRLQVFREAMREFYAPLKALEPQLRFVFLTGITKFSQLSIFSELNNLQNISMLPAYAGICGITEEELTCDMASDIAYLAERTEQIPDETLEKLKATYDGYHFCWPSPDIYNPFSLITALQNGSIGSYWFGSGTPTSLVEMLRESCFDLMDLDGGVEASASAFDAPTEDAATPVAFMYQAGYLTIKGYDSVAALYELGIPNGEVRDGLFEVLLPAVTGTTLLKRDALLGGLRRALAADDFDAVLRELRSFMGCIPYDMAPKNEKDFQTVLFLAFSILGASIHSEVRTSAGRVDLVIESSTTIYVVELKYDGSAAEAIEQIDTKGYLIPWQAQAAREDGKRVVKVGASFSPEQRTIEEGWIIEEATCKNCNP